MVNTEKKDHSLWGVGIYLCTRLTMWLVLPVIGSFFLGKFLDNYFDTKPIFFFIALGIAFIVSQIGIIKEASRCMRDLDLAGRAKVVKDKNK